MTEKRKLQQEIERVLKRVAEGVEEFEGLWDKVHTTSNSAQREKFEGDLKKEIKKLQRLRDQIKTWQQSNDIKDKSDLLKNRKLIETQMERFKVMEREMKTKTFSKGGLSMAFKVDPNAKAKQEIREWINQFTDQLTIQIDQFEAEIESLNSKKKKTRKEEERVQHLDMSIARHRDHEKKLEIILRMLDNDSLNVEQVDELKDDLDYYLENNQEADFNENEYLYDDLNLDLTMQDDDEDDDESQGDMDEVREEPKEKKKSKRDDKDEEEVQKQELTKKPSLTKQVSIPKGTAATPQPQLSATRTPSLPTSTPVAPAAAATTPATKPTTAPAKTAAVVAKGAAPPTPTTPVSAPLTQPPTPVVVATSVVAGAAAAVAAAAVTAKKAKPKETQPPAQTNIAPPAPAAEAETPQFSQTVAQAPVQKPPQKPVAPPAQSAASGPSLVQQQAQLQAQLQTQQQLVKDQQRQQPPTQPLPDPPAPTTTTLPALVPTQQSPALSSQIVPNSEQGFVTGAEVPERPSEIPSAAATLNATMQALFSSLINMPEISDSERSKTYMPRNPASVPAHFPAVPAPILDNATLLEKFDAETLFFMFYHQPGTYQQYLAARELKRQSWRFHKKYLTWFQRLEDPKVITDEYEQGTYVYFDYETGWCQRRKADFKFEYRFLEDQELP